MNTPNKLSILRIILIPFFIYFYLTADSVGGYILSAAILLVSGLTDMLDGYIARKYHMITDLGKILDPLADKLTQASVCICIALKTEGFFLLMALFVVKELLMCLGGLKIMRSGVAIQGSKWFGKAATVVFYIVMFLVILFPDMPKTLLNTLIIIAAVFMIFAFVMYVRIFWHILQEDKVKHTQDHSDDSIPREK